MTTATKTIATALMIPPAVLVPVPVAPMRDVLARAYATTNLGIVMITTVRESIYLEVV